MGVVLKFVVLILAMTEMPCALGKRPDWMPQLERAFQLVFPYKQSAKPERKCNSRYYSGSGEIWSNMDFGFHLCHVLSWAQMKRIIDKCYEVQTVQSLNILQELVKMVFTVDDEAVVSNRFCGPEKGTLKKHEDILGKKALGGLSNLGEIGSAGHKSLLEVNEDYRKEAFRRVYLTDSNDDPMQITPVDLANFWNLMMNDVAGYGATSSTKTNRERLERLLNSAPANLRYGDGATNKLIGSTLDPMGKSKKKGGGFTMKERAIHGFTNYLELQFGIDDVSNSDLSLQGSFFFTEQMSASSSGAHWLYLKATGVSLHDSYVLLERPHNAICPGETISGPEDDWTCCCQANPHCCWNKCDVSHTEILHPAYQNCLSGVHNAVWIANYKDGYYQAVIVDEDDSNDGDDRDDGDDNDDAGVEP